MYAAFHYASMHVWGRFAPSDQHLPGRETTTITVAHFHDGFANYLAESIAHYVE